MSNINLGQKMQSLAVGRKLDSYTGVLIHAGQSSDGSAIDYFAGNSSGYVLEIDNPLGTQAMAQTILDGLKLRGTRYQPFEAGSAILDPSAELGDNVTVNGVSSILFRKLTRHSHLMAADVAAPHDEEVDHEFPFVSPLVREFKRESAYARSRLTINADAIAAEVTRATGAEGTLSASVLLQADRITAEVNRATTEEGTLRASIIVQADRITSEVTRAEGAESSLGTRIDQRLDGITLSVSSASGSSTFAIKDGSTTLDTKTLDLTVKAVNITGKLTVGQIQSGDVVVSSKTETEYYLSTSSSSATGGEWLTNVPSWSPGKYIWTRTKTTSTKNAAQGETPATTVVRSDAAYDENLTTALSTATAANTTAGTANTNANSAEKRSTLLYRSTSGGSAPSAPSAWVTDVTGGQNKWTQVRPEYSSSYPALYIAQQSETVGGTYSCSTPKLDATTTVIDGAHIITGTIDATKIAVTDLNALGATIGGWTITASSLRNMVTNTYDVGISTDTSHIDNYAIWLRTYEDGAWKQQFNVTYGGKLYARNAEIAGNITATSGTIGGVTINANGVLSGINYNNIASGGITGGQGGCIASSAVTTWNTASGINTSLGYADYYGTATTGGVNPSYCPMYYTVGYQLNIGSSNYGAFVYRGLGVSWRWSDVLGAYYLGSSGEG